MRQSSNRALYRRDHCGKVAWRDVNRPWDAKHQKRRMHYIRRLEREDLRRQLLDLE